MIRAVRFGFFQTCINGETAHIASTDDVDQHAVLVHHAQTRHILLAKFYSSSQPAMESAAHFQSYLHLSLMSYVFAHLLKRQQRSIRGFDHQRFALMHDHFRDTQVARLANQVEILTQVVDHHALRQQGGDLALRRDDAHTMETASVTIQHPIKLNHIILNGTAVSDGLVTMHFHDELENSCCTELGKFVINLPCHHLECVK